MSSPLQATTCFLVCIISTTKKDIFKVLKKLTYLVLPSGEPSNFSSKKEYMQVMLMIKVYLWLQVVNADADPSADLLKNLLQSQVCNKFMPKL